MNEATVTLIITVAGVLVALLERIRRDLGANTKITEEAKTAANGRLSDALRQLANERDLVQGLRYLVRERDDRIAYIVARLPQAEQLMREYGARQERKATDADERAAAQRAMGDTDQ